MHLVENLTYFGRREEKKQIPINKDENPFPILVLLPIWPFLVLMPIWHRKNHFSSTSPFSPEPRTKAQIPAKISGSKNILGFIKIGFPRGTGRRTSKSNSISISFKS